MPRRLIDPEWQLRRFPIITAIGAALALACFLVVLLIWINLSGDAARRNRALICQLDELFGLDRPLPPGALRRLRPSQKEALRQIIQACPDLGRKGTP